MRGLGSKLRTKDKKPGTGFTPDKRSFKPLSNPMAHYRRLCRSFGVVLGGCL
jgi:hypothetical protein